MLFRISALAGAPRELHYRDDFSGVRSPGEEELDTVLLRLDLMSVKPGSL